MGVVYYIGRIIFIPYVRILHFQNVSHSLSLSFPILFQIPRKRTVGRLYYYYYYYYYHHHPQQSPFIFLELVDGKNEIIFKDRKI